MVDLDGAKASEPRNLAVLERVATKTTLEVQYGGGIKSRGALRSVIVGKALYEGHITLEELKRCLPNA